MKIKYLTILMIIVITPVIGCTRDTSPSTTPNPVNSEYEQSRTLSISGTGSVKVFPNLITISAQVTAVNKSVLAAREEAAETMTALLRTLEKNQITEEDVSTTSFRISERKFIMDMLLYPFFT